ncbi:MAG: uroporphyrinogen decarboxylase family protein [Planctomycetota bacterium]|jgi:uroporphyrinogen-III decarboxylase
MTKKEAFLMAVRGETPDVVPVAPLIHCRFADKVLGRSDWKAIFEVHQTIGSCYHRGPLGIDIPVTLPAGYAYDSGEQRPRAGGGTEEDVIIRTPNRTMTGTYAWGMIPDDPVVGKMVDYPVKSREDWLAYKDLLEQYIAGEGEPDFARLDEAYAHMGEDGIAGVGTVCAYAILGNNRSMQGLMLDLFDEPDLMGELFELEHVRLGRWVDAFLASVADVMWLDVCWATGSQLPPTWFEKWVLPDIALMMDKVRQALGKYAGLYTLGPIREYLPMFADTGVNFVETFEPNEGNISLGEAKKLYGDKMCLMGNFDCLVLAFGSMDDARKEARRCLEEGMQGGGYVLATADEVPANAKPDNLKAMVETVQKFGRY